VTVQRQRIRNIKQEDLATVVEDNPGDNIKKEVFPITKSEFQPNSELANLSQGQPFSFLMRKATSNS